MEPFLRQSLLGSALHCRRPSARPPELSALCLPNGWSGPHTAVRVSSEFAVCDFGLTRPVNRNRQHQWLALIVERFDRALVAPVRQALFAARRIPSDHPFDLTGDPCATRGLNFFLRLAESAAAFAFVGGTRRQRHKQFKAVGESLRGQPVQRRSAVADRRAPFEIDFDHHRRFLRVAEEAEGAFRCVQRTANRSLRERVQRVDFVGDRPDDRGRAHHPPACQGPDRPGVIEAQVRAEQEPIGSPGHGRFLAVRIRVQPRRTPFLPVVLLRAGVGINGPYSRDPPQADAGRFRAATAGGDQEPCHRYQHQAGEPPHAAQSRSSPVIVESTGPRAGRSSVGTEPQTRRGSLPTRGTTCQADPLGFRRLHRADSRGDRRGVHRPESRNLGRCPLGDPVDSWDRAAHPAA